MGKMSGRHSETDRACRYADNHIRTHVQSSEQCAMGKKLAQVFELQTGALRPVCVA